MRANRPLYGKKAREIGSLRPPSSSSVSAILYIGQKAREIGSLRSPSSSSLSAILETRSHRKKKKKAAETAEDFRTWPSAGYQQESKMADILYNAGE